MTEPLTARTLARSPFALLAWVLSAHTPADLLGERCRAMVMRALLDVGRAARAAADVPRLAQPDIAALAALGERASAAAMALGEDFRALTEEALPAPGVLIDGFTVARVMFAFAHELEERGLEGAAALLPMTFDAATCERLATRASAVEFPSAERIAKVRAKRRP